jgi:hypothetical protein
MAEKKKGIPAMAFVGGGCLIIIILAAVAVGMLVKKGKEWLKDPARKVAELAIKKDPNLELVKSDDRSKTITYRDKRTGEETTVNWDQIAAGKITVKSAEGTTSMEFKDGKATIVGQDGKTTIEVGGGPDKLPAWFEVPEGITNWQSAAHQESGAGQVSGFIAGESERAMEELLADVETNLTAAGFTRKAKTELPDGAALQFEHAERKQALAITLVQQADKASVTITIGYEQR